jgi:hypothetical protein
MALLEVQKGGGEGAHLANIPSSSALREGAECHERWKYCSRREVDCISAQPAERHTASLCCFPRGLTVALAHPESRLSPWH